MNLRSSRSSIEVVGTQPKPDQKLKRIAKARMNHLIASNLLSANPGLAKE